jgi:protein CrcB
LTINDVLLGDAGQRARRGARFFVSGLAAQHIGQTFPIGTLIVNVTGSFVIGFFATLTAPDGRVFVSSDARQFVMTGLCGGYTTFSSFSLQTLNPRRRKSARRRQRRPVGRSLPARGLGRLHRGQRAQSASGDLI